RCSSTWISFHASFKTSSSTFRSWSFKARLYCGNTSVVMVEASSCPSLAPVDQMMQAQWKSAQFFASNQHAIMFRCAPLNFPTGPDRARDLEGLVNFILRALANNPRETQTFVPVHRLKIGAFHAAVYNRVGACQDFDARFRFWPWTLKVREVRGEKIRNSCRGSVWSGNAPFFFGHRSREGPRSTVLWTLRHERRFLLEPFRSGPEC